MNLCQGPQNPKYRASEPQRFPPNFRKRPFAIEWSRLGPAERRLARHEMDSECSRHLLEPEFEVPPPGSSVVMTPQREAMANCSAGLESQRETDLPLAKNPAHRQERQLPSGL